jgi:DNA-binding GntR family transcriptional regulator
VEQLRQKQTGVQMEAFTQKKNYSLSERVYQVIVDKLSDGQLNPGDKVTEADIAIEMGISRAPIREAFIRLAKDNLLELVPRTGCFVCRVDADKVMEIHGIRKRLEGFALELASKNLTKEEITAFREDLVSCYDCSSDSILKAATEAEIAFHAFFADNAHAASLQNILAKINQWSQIFRGIYQRYVVDPKQMLEAIAVSKQAHLEILNVLIAGDSSGAARLLEEHIENSKNGFLEILNKHASTKVFKLKQPIAAYDQSGRPAIDKRVALNV